ncbi:MAG: hypothetical protein R3C08_07730 [Hyphomonas sp.]
MTALPARFLPAAFLLASVLVPAACAHRAPYVVPLSAYDAVAVAPGSHEVLLENDEIRVLRVSIAPGVAEPVHEHQWPSVMYFEQPQPITYVTYELKDGQLVETGREDAPAMPAELTVLAEPEGLHSVENRGSEPFLAVRVEFKKGDPAGAAQPAP